jgi:hypothetical protein
MSEAGGHPEIDQTEVLDFYAACRWLDRQAGQRASASVLGTADGFLQPTPLATVGLLQPGLATPHPLYGPGRRYALEGGAGVAGSFWIGEDVVVGRVRRTYLEGGPALEVLMRFDALPVLLLIQMIDAGDLARQSEFGPTPGKAD